MQKVVTTNELELEKLKREQTEEAHIVSYEDAPIQHLAVDQTNSDINTQIEDDISTKPDNTDQNQTQDETTENTDSEEQSLPMTQLSEGGISPKEVDDHDGHYIPKERAFGQGVQPDSAPRDLSIPGVGSPLVFDEQQEVFEAIQPIEDDCPAPEGAISFDSFKELFQTYVDRSLTSGTIVIDTIDQLRQAVECINEINSYNGGYSGISYDFTLFLGKNVYNFDGETSGYDGTADIDIRLDSLGFGADYLTILGCGCEDTVIDAKGFDRIFDISGGNVTISKILLTGGVAQYDNFDFQDRAYSLDSEATCPFIMGANFGEEEAYIGETYNYTQGGAIRSYGNLTVDDSCIIGNEADLGGGIYTEEQYWWETNTLTVTNSLVDSNIANYNGGGVFSFGSTVQVEYSDVTNNTSGFQGGGIAAVDYGSYFSCYPSITSNEFSTVNIIGSHIDNNTSGNNIGVYDEDCFDSADGSGGGIFVMNYNLNVSDGSTVDNNYAIMGSGGGIAAWNSSNYYLDEGCCFDLFDQNIIPMVKIDNSTVNNNQAEQYGGAIALHHYNLEVVGNSEVNNNISYENGSAIYSEDLILECDEDEVEDPPAETPIVFDLNGNGLDLVAPENSGITLMDGERLYQLGWVGPTDGLLVYDINQDGLVNSLAEIELSRYFAGAQTDLQGLKGAFDSNHDNLFNANDDLFDLFGMFQDVNSNGITDSGEFQTLAQAGIIEIDLAAVDSVSWVNGNKIFGEGVFTMANGEKGIFADVALTKQEVLPESTILGLDSNSSVAPTFVENSLVGHDDLVAFMPPLSTQESLESQDGSLFV